MEGQQTLGGRYRLLNELGSGGMAVVWRARDEVLGRSVAVKLLAGRFAGDPQSRARIRDEARAAATLSHPNIAQVYDFGEQQELPYVVMELINGPTLAQRVAFGPLPPRTVFRICGEVASALAAAHADGLVHRDIKPANVMVTPTGAKVVDFGIAAAAGPAVPDEVLLGTPAYLAPERLTGAAVEPASDVYALGVLLYRLLANESPWSVESTTQMLDAHVYVEPAPLPQLAGVPPEVTELVHRCLRKEPGERPTAAEASAVLVRAARSPVSRAQRDDHGGHHSLWRGAGGQIPLTPAARVAAYPDSAAAADHAEPEAGAPPAPVPPARPLPAPDPGRRLVLGATAAVLAVIAALTVWLLLPGGAGEDRPSRSAAVVPSLPRQPGGEGDGTQSLGVRPAPAAQEQPNRLPIVPTAPPSTPAVSAPAGNEGTATPVEPSISTTPAGTTPPAPGGRELSSPGGSVTARCVEGNQARLTSWTPNPSYEVERVYAGPALTTAIVFRDGRTRIRMTVTCVGGVPSAVVLPL